MTHEQIYKAVLTKWNYLVKYPKAESEELYELEYDKGKFLVDFEHDADCGYCYLFIDNDCEGCPLRPKHCDFFYSTGCYQVDHPFRIFYLDNTSENAKKVLNLIKKNKEKILL